ncbi:hypothetical protein EVAR_67202_1 [Eumeta japonica]|uniref:Uncharacterized protein n=1 Tax=Eumeta variegata TaxID=151549 RepID=A0A4C2A621_EUMVA|nr:hypothetical protein EVAR_67202_1 [Eumeta japonica]
MSSAKCLNRSKSDVQDLAGPRWFVSRDGSDSAFRNLLSFHGLEEAWHGNKSSSMAFEDFLAPKTGNLDASLTEFACLVVVLTEVEAESPAFTWNLE